MPRAPDSGTPDRRGRAHGLRPAGLRAIDIARVEAGLVLIEVDYTSAPRAPAEQEYSPFEIGLGRLVNFEKADFVGKRALLRGAKPRAARRGGWSDSSSTGPASRAVARHGLPPAVQVDRLADPDPDILRGQVGRATSTAGRRRSRR